MIKKYPRVLKYSFDFKRLDIMKKYLKALGQLFFFIHTDIDMKRFLSDPTETTVRPKFWLPNSRNGMFSTYSSTIIQK